MVCSEVKVLEHWSRREIESERAKVACCRPETG